MVTSTMRTKVACVKGKDPRAMTSRALRLIESMIEIEPEDKVLIKPNCVRPLSPMTGVTTDSRIVEAVIDYVEDIGARDITIAEGGSPGTDKAFEITGLSDVARRRDVKLVNLNKDDWEEITIPSGSALKKVNIARTVLDSTCIINVPKLKVHHMAQVTLSLKNLMGTIVGNRGQVMHHRLDEKLVDLASLFKPRLNVIDGIVGAEMDEVRGNPVPVNAVIAGVDMVATDVVGSAIMGIDPKSVRHVQMAARRGLGVGSLEDINVIGDPIESIRKEFSQEFSAEKLKSYGLSRPLTVDDVSYMKKQFER